MPARALPAPFNIESEPLIFYLLGCRHEIGNSEPAQRGVLECRRGRNGARVWLWKKELIEWAMPALCFSMKDTCSKALRFFSSSAAESSVARKGEFFCKSARLARPRCKVLARLQKESVSESRYHP